MTNTRPRGLRIWYNVKNVKTVSGSYKKHTAGSSTLEGKRVGGKMGGWDTTRGRHSQRGPSGTPGSSSSSKKVSKTINCVKKWSDPDSDLDPNSPKCSIQNRTGPVANDVSQDPQRCQKIEKQHSKDHDLLCNCLPDFIAMVIGNEISAFNSGNIS
jgi:hypothetical protein